MAVQMRPLRERLETNPSRPAALNATLVCVGYFYIGQWKKGLVAMLAALIFGIPTLGIALIPLNTATAVDVSMQVNELLAGRQIGDWTFFRKTIAG